MIKRFLVRIGVLLAVFTCGVAVTSFLMNGSVSSDGAYMKEATFPEVMVEIDGMYVNRMFGYAQKMQIDFTRDSLTPMDTSKKITLAINPYSCELYNLSYEIRTSDGGKVIENSSTRKMTSQDSYLIANLKLKTDEMLMNQEYSLQITLDTSVGEVYYYTRIIQRAQLNTSQYVEFVQLFYERCIDKETGTRELSAYVESDESVADNNFTSINIHSSLDMITWGTLAPSISQKAVPTIKDINETTGSISLDYEVTAKDENKQEEVYHVNDFYRMRYGEEGVLLLDFTRDTQQIFDGELDVVDDNGLTVGVASNDIQYMSDSSGEIVAFVQEGDLWTYNRSGNKLARVFSFRQDEEEGSRDTDNILDIHDVKIIRIDESGNMDFVIYGYFNRGIHEGMVGVGVYHYSSDQNLVDEQVFIPSTESYEFLKMDIGNLSYINGQNQLFLLLGGNLYQVDIDGQSYEIIQDGIKTGHFVSSASNASGAWMVGDDLYNCTKIRTINFETGETRKIQSKEGGTLRALGFLNEDLVYGLARNENIVTDAAGKKVYAMDSLRIEDFQGNVVKEYSQADQYIIDANINDTLMEIQLAKRVGNVYVSSGLDNIMNNRKMEEEQVSISSAYTERKGFVIHLDFEQTDGSGRPAVVFSKHRVGSGEETVLDVDTQVPVEELYYVYAGGKLDSIYTDPAQAIAQADEKVGVVLNRSQQYVWERGNKKTKVQLNLSDVPAAILEGTLDYEALASRLDAGMQPMNFSGCTLDQVLYSVSAQRPVIAARGDGGSYVIVGYDEYNTIVYNPDNQETKYMAMDESTELFQGAGNVFYSYLE